MKFKPSHKKVKMENVHEYLQSIHQGVGSHKPKKGKGSYSRKNKHKNKLD